MEDRIKKLCGIYLGWNETGHHIVVEKLGKGCSNEVLIATLQDTSTSTPLDKVLVRMYGSNITRRLLQDVYINCHLGTLGRIPRIRGLFEGGRFEEFLPCTNISRDVFSGAYRDLMKLIVEVHKLEMPLPREPCLERLLRDMLEGVKREAERWRGEVDWYVASLRVIGRDLNITFCHNDFNMNNLLIPTSSSSTTPSPLSSSTTPSPLSSSTTPSPLSSSTTPSPLSSSTTPSPLSSSTTTSPLSSSTTPILIDYEYSGYNYSLYDLANYCTEMQYDWSHDQAPYFRFSSQWFPDNAKMLDMICRYNTLSSVEVPCNSIKKENKVPCNSIKKENKVPCNSIKKENKELCNSTFKQNDDSVALTQLKFLVLGSELLWTLWSLSCKGFSLEMGDYLRAKSESYLTKKAEYMEEIQQLLNSYSSLNSP